MGDGLSPSLCEDRAGLLCGLALSLSSSPSTSSRVLVRARAAGAAGTAGAEDTGAGCDAIATLLCLRRFGGLGEAVSGISDDITVCRGLARSSRGRSTCRVLSHPLESELQNRNMSIPVEGMSMDLLSSLCFLGERGNLSLHLRENTAILRKLGVVNGSGGWDEFKAAET